MKNRSNNSFLSMLSFRQYEYSKLYVFLMFCVVLEVIRLTESLWLTDILYFILAVYFAIRALKKKRKQDINIMSRNKWRCFVYPFAFLTIAIIGYFSFGATRMFQSQMRFILNCTIFASIYAYFRSNTLKENERLVSSYVYVCVICSFFVIIQFLSFYIFHFNIKFDIGDFNDASLATYTQSASYRTGGFFNEPSWFALFTGPVLEIAYRLKKYKEMCICITGIILSTSSMGFLFLFLFLLFKARGRNKKILLFMLLGLLIIYFLFPFVFDRFFSALGIDDGNNTNNIRVILPLTVAFAQSLPLFGMDIGNIYLMEDELFLNTFVFVLLAFGIVGILFFLKLLWKKNNLQISLILLSGVVIEGCYGRVDFWMMLLAASVFVDNCNYSCLKYHY